VRKLPLLPTGTKRLCRGNQSKGDYVIIDLRCAVSGHGLAPLCNQVDRLTAMLQLPPSVQPEVMAMFRLDIVAV